METGGCCFPDDRLYDSEATIWVQLHANSFTIGLTQLQAFAVGKVNSIQPKPVGSNLEAGRSIGFIETVSYSGNARTPLGGVVEEVNAEVVENPAMINADPYGRGWIARLSAQNLGTERVLLSTPDNAAKVAAKLIRDRGLHDVFRSTQLIASRASAETALRP